MINNDRIYTYVPVGKHLVEFGSLDRYFRHSFADHEDDIMGWDLVRGEFHRMVVYSRTDKNLEWDREDDEALEKMMDDFLACPVCHKIHLYSSKWYCGTCQRQTTLKDVANALNTYKREKGVQRSI